MTNVQTKKFQRTIEDFVCDNCGFKVKGTGYTNHCPKCLWSKHVDVNPGDRQETCNGLMQPIGLELKNQERVIIFRCLKYDQAKKNKANQNDDNQALIELSAKN